MKKLNLIIVFALASLTTFAQELKYDDLFSEKRPPGSFKSYVSKDEIVFRVGDTIKIGTPVPGYSFAYIWVGDGVLMEDELLGPYASNSEVVIKRIVVGGYKKDGYKALFRTTGMPDMIRGLIIIVEKALQSGEIIAIQDTLTLSDR